ncbi:hypothetical protein [Nannocystis pusilla]|uniref:hypothetical protein n=1 Tax=Nannocystis pusilla TaxID=889268 RepID=UPI003B8250D8
MTPEPVKSYRAFVAAGNPPHALGDAKQPGLVCTWSLPTTQEWGWAAQGRDETAATPGATRSCGAISP